MRVHCYFLIAIISLVSGGSALAKAMHIPLDQKCKESDLIAVIDITRIQNKGAAKPYRKIATGRIVESIKGKVEAKTFQLDFDNGLTCPNVLYQRGQRCIVFLKKHTSGHFSTYNSYFGAYSISTNTVLGWEFKADTRLDVVRKEIQQHLEPAK